MFDNSISDMFVIFLSVAVPVGFGYLFFRLIKPKVDTGNKSYYFAQLFLAWSIFISTSLTMRPFLIVQDSNTLMFWVLPSFVFGLLATIIGFVYGKFR